MNISWKYGKEIGKYWARHNSAILVIEESNVLSIQYSLGVHESVGRVVTVDQMSPSSIDAIIAELKIEEREARVEKRRKHFIENNPIGKACAWVNSVLG
jgi:hypothetical protein